MGRCRVTVPRDIALVIGIVKLWRFSAEGHRHTLTATDGVFADGFLGHRMLA